MSPGIVLPAFGRVVGDSHAAATEASTGLLEASIEHEPSLFLTPSLATYEAILTTAKQQIDPLATYTSEEQQRRLEASWRKRKRGRRDDGESERSILQIKQLHLRGFSSDGVWAQAKRILDASAKEIERDLEMRLALRPKKEAANDTEQPIRMVRFDEEGFEIDSDDEDQTDADDLEEAEDDDQDEELEGSDIGVDEDGMDSDEMSLGDEEEGGEEDIEAGSDLEGSGEDDGRHRGGILVKDKHGLNDGFFDIDEFNRDTEFMEQTNANGEEESDEEKIDYFADPMATSSTAKRPKKSKGDAEASEGSDDEGPGFGNANLNAPWSDDEKEDDVDMEALQADGDDEEGNANDILYADFYDPPARALTKTKRMRALPKTQPEADEGKPSDQDIQRTIDSVRRDLFEDDFSDPDADSDELDEDAPGMKNLSTHERRKVALAKQIRELEAAAIEKRSWQMSGEASAHARPMNALLEEDLEFERAGKPVPVITAEVSSSIEDMIKQRILNRQFDEVVKRRPGSEPGSALGTGQPRRGRLELSDQRDPQSLAESYEQSYLTQTDPNAKDPRSDALKAQHAEIERLWADVSGKLDALTSWRYKPKPAAVEVKVVTDAPKILMEDARPSGVEGVQGEQSGLAPQEVFQVGDKENAKEEGVVTTKGGAVIAKAELSREDKTRRRRREKERAKKANISGPPASTNVKSDAAAPAKTSKSDQTEILKQLKAGGVKVIGKGGELRDVDGEKVRRTEQGKGGAFKL